MTQVRETAERTDQPWLLGGLANQMAMGWAAMVALAADSRAIGTRNGEQLT